LNALVANSRKLSRTLRTITFEPPVAAVYDPTQYAAQPHERYLERWGEAPREVILVGMNPGPFGMAQTGVPFGEVAMVRDFVGVTGVVKQPVQVHPKRPVQGFDCTRSEVSGARLWGWARDRFGTAERFFARFFVHNYCPLCFMDEGGRNLTPDKLPAATRAVIEAACDESLRTLVAHLHPRWVIGVGAFAQKRAEIALHGVARAPRIATILHPSPASPAANRGWAAQVDKQLGALGIAVG
jgi:single-strand selective monofunctional uracil DNA glycosylase